MTAQDERAKVAAWLRRLAGCTPEDLIGQPPRGECWVLHRAADAIEAGDHHKEETQ